MNEKRVGSIPPEVLKEFHQVVEKISEAFRREDFVVEVQTSSEVIYLLKGLGYTTKSISTNEQGVKTWKITGW